MAGMAQGYRHCAAKQQFRNRLQVCLLVFFDTLFYCASKRMLIWAAASSVWKWALCSTLGALGRRGNDGRPDVRRGPRPVQDLAKDEHQALQQHHAEDQNRVSARLAGRH